MFLASFLIKFLSPEMQRINIHTPSSLSRTIMSGYSLGCFCRRVLFVSIKWLLYLHDIFVLVLVFILLLLFLLLVVVVTIVVVVVVVATLLLTP
jgi:hypothetical protein